MDTIRNWFLRHLNNPQVVGLAILLIAGFALIMTLGDMLAPVLASLVIAYLLEGLVRLLEQRGVRRILAVTLVFTVFLAVLMFMLLGILPRLSNQITQLIQQFPDMVARGHEKLLLLPQKYPNFIAEEQITQMIAAIRTEVGSFGQRVLSLSVASLVGLITFMVYVILVPMLVFFFLKDKSSIVGWFTSYLPRERALSAMVWADVDRQIGNYVRGKVWEIFIVGGVTYIMFVLMGLQYAVLLATLVGLSVIIPYIGALVVTIPVGLIAYFQWGWTGDFAWLMVGYLIIQALDGNVLVPLLFSEVVNLHPIAIIVSVLLFGGIWGFWGVFFAIPLATLVQAVLKAWPKALEAEAG
ncbi:MAG: AI-2E family transporter [Gammaproteobacteria bacterium]|nr:AI-2E family transporter [Gammaproteobacteria bacterium]